MTLDISVLGSKFVTLLVSTAVKVYCHFVRITEVANNDIYCVLFGGPRRPARYPLEVVFTKTPFESAAKFHRD